MSAHTTSVKLQPGSTFPALSANISAEQKVQLGKASGNADWRLLVVYRGKHCPLCTKYLNALEAFKQQLNDIKVDILAVSADNAQQLQQHKDALNVSFPLAYGLTVEQMQQLGLCISDPRSAQETDHPFAEPGLFVINQAGQIQVMDISNNPFCRPELATLVNGLRWIRDPQNNYPIRGMRPYS